MTSEWKAVDDTTSDAWESMVVSGRGYPLQTALWGDARAVADGSRSERLLLLRNGQPILLARVEVRHHRLAGKVAWIPQGPVYLDAQAAYEADIALKAELRGRGYQLCFENPRGPELPRYRDHSVQVGEAAQTSVVDLSIGQEALWHRLSANWRNNVRLAERSGIRVGHTHDAAAVRQFVAEGEQLSVAKRFRFQGSEGLIARLLAGSGNPDVYARLYCASLAHRFLGGVLVMVVGKTMELMFSVATRADPSPGRLLQWTAMKAAIDAKVTRYDLGGMDAAGNPGVYEFKRQLKGELVTIPPVRASALSVRGRIALAGGRMLGRV